MLPQIMPFSWLLVFYVVFFLFYSIFFFTKFYLLDALSSYKKVKVSFLSFSW